MKIPPISFYNHRLIKINNNINNQKTIQIRQTPVDNNVITFMHTAQNADPLRILMKLGMVDIYTGKFVIDPDYFERILQQKAFNRPLHMIIKMLEPLKGTLHKVPLEIFEDLKEYAKNNPNTHLDSVFKQWAADAQTFLYEKMQKPIFHTLEDYAKELPQARKEEFDKLIHDSKEQINQRSIPKEFNKTDFRYKLVRISQRIKQSNFSEEVSVINKLINMSKTLPDDIKKKSSVKRNKKAQKLTRKRLDIIKQMRSYYEQSVLNDDAELRQLFSDVISQIYKIPVFIPFSRKNFIEDLKKITEHINDEDLVRKIVQEAVKLPTATQEKTAFIVKASRKSSEKIGFDLLIGSVGNIEHLKARVDGGRDTLSNYAVSTNLTNSDRGNRTMKKQFKLHPEAYAGCQIYINRLIHFANTGILRKVGLTKSYVINFAKRMEKMVPNLKLDISELK